MTTQTQIALIKRLAPYLDAHVLLQFLKNSVPASEGLQQKISDQLLISQKDKAVKLEEEAKNEASKLLTIINNHQEWQTLRTER